MINNNIYFFNISYSDSIFVILFGDKNIGIDVERKSTINKKIVNRFFSSEEKEYIYNSSDQNYSFIKLWTYKEACVKYNGRGIDKYFKKTSTIMNKKLIESYFGGKIISLDYKEYIITLIYEV